MKPLSRPRRRRVNRRAFLRGAGAVAVGLPFLEGLPERSAWGGPSDPGGPPVFAFFICTACGVVMESGRFGGGEPERFWPTQTGQLTSASMQAFANDRSTGILAPHADRLLIVRGLSYPNRSTGCGHAQGLAQCLTASPPQGSNQETRATGPSADVIISEALDAAGTEPLTLYSGMKGGYIEDMLSFRGEGGNTSVVGSEGNPFRAYTRLMGFIPDSPAVVPGGGPASLLAEHRRSVNDMVRLELNDLRNSPKLSQADRDRLDLHFQSIRDLENGMTSMAASCSTDSLDMTALSALEGGQAFRANGAVEEVARLQAQIVGLAFACNAHRVATLQCGDGTDGTNYTINGQQAERFHYISHRQNSDGNDGTPIADAVEKHVAIDRIRMETFRDILDRWSEYQVENGALLDNSFILWTNHVAVGPSHSFSNLPYIIAGSAGGRLRQGQYVQVDRTTDVALNTLISVTGVTGDGDGPFTNLAGRNGGLLNEMLA